MSIMYCSTRGDKKLFHASEAIIKGLAPDGGLFVPTEFPKLSVSLDDLKNMDYKQIAYIVMKDFLEDYTEEELRNCIDKAYDSKFDTEEIVPLVTKGNKHFLELFHGPTIAFKDMALSILPHLLTTAIKKNSIDREVVILTATSGDTGKAALAGFAGVEGTKIIVFYPKGGVSRIQELQMVTQKESNTKVIGVKGNFDDCQSAVKRMFSDPNLASELAKRGYSFSSANSINIGRLMPQVAYYVYAYSRLIKNGVITAGDRINFTVPTGNFGNILAAYYAKQMGLPINKLICASNDNKVLYDFIRTNVYDRRREFILTTSPSMDILISSNLERLIYECVGRDGAKCAMLMNSLNQDGIYSLGEEEISPLSDFYSAYADQQEVSDTISEIYEQTGYVIDTHTAVAASAAKQYRNNTDDSLQNIIISTASPYKFTKSVMSAIYPQNTEEDDFVLVDKLSECSATSIPNAIKEIQSANIVHNTVCAIEDMECEVKSFLF